MKRLLMISLFMTCACVVYAQEEPQPPEDPARRRQIERWVEELSAGDFDTREKAYAKLLEAGDDAVYALIPAAEQEADFEKSDRARELLEKIEWVSPEERKEIRRLLELLMSSREAEEWNAALEKLKEIGKRARIEFEKIAATPEGEAAISVTRKSEVVERGEPVACEVTVENRGETPFWIETDRLQSLLLPQTFFKQTREPDRLLQAMAGLGGHARVIDGKVVTFTAKKTPEGTAPYVYLKPGESFSFSVTHEGEETDWIGPAEIRATYDPTAAGALRVAGGGRGVFQLRGRARLMEQRVGKAPTGEWPEIIPLEKTLLESPKVVLVPPAIPAGREPTVNGLSLTLSEPEEDEKSRVVLTWTNRTNRAITVPAWDKGERYGLWFVLFDEDGTFLRGGGIEEPPPSENRQWTVLKPGESIFVEVEIPSSGEERKGTVRIVIGTSEIPRHLPEGYSNRNVQVLRGARGREPVGGRNAGERMGMEKQERSAWKGILHSNVLEIDPSGE